MADPILIVFLIVAAYITVGRFFADQYLRALTYLAVTTQRALIVYRGIWPKTSSILLGSSDNISLAEHSNSRGTITFSNMASSKWFMARRQGHAGFGTQIPTDTFEAIENARDVYNTILKVQQDLTSPAIITTTARQV